VGGDLTMHESGGGSVGAGGQGTAVGASGAGGMPMSGGAAGQSVADAAAPKDANVVVHVEAGTPYCARGDMADHRAQGAPTLVPGVWKDISPPDVFIGPQYAGGQGFTFDPSNPSILYAAFDSAATGKGGVYKSTDAGSTWAHIGPSKLDFPMHPRVDPKDPQHLYVGGGVRSGLQGVFVSNDGGNNFHLPPGFETWAKAEGTYDTYDIATDPTDFNHVLASFHSPWRSSSDSGVAESKDGGETWVGHPIKGSGAGNSASFLFNPSLGIGNSSTWLVGTQGSGFWRTTDAGATWNKVSTTGMTHGGNQIYYSHAGLLYSGGYPKVMRSTDNGITWTQVGADGSYTSVFGDGSHLYTMRYYGPAPFITASESDGMNWAPYEGGAQKFVMGPFEQAFDATNGILYSSTWQSNLLALKVKCP
jgi:hypothetical protein